MIAFYSLRDETIEFIVIDGGSDDGTRELLAQHDSDINYWVSEPDKGIYDAMNKGVAAARGEFIFHLNAGDRLLWIPRKELRAAALATTEVAAFRVLIDGKKEFRPSNGIALRLTNTLHHQGTFFRRDNFPEYDLRYKVFADFDVNQRLARRGAVISTYDLVVASHKAGGISDVASGENILEFFDVITKNYGLSYIPMAWLLCKWRGFCARLTRFTN